MGIAARLAPFRVNLKTNALKPYNGKTVLVGHGGGLCPASEAVIEGIVCSAKAHGGIRIVGAVDGFKGILDGDVVELTPDNVAGIAHGRGVCIGTSRRNPNPEERQTIIQQFGEWGIDGAIGIGGDDTNTTVARMAADGFPFVGVPKTIDNDIPGTDITYGHQTVIEAAKEQLLTLKEDARSQDTVAAYMVSVMGRKSGSWALEAARAARATTVMIPEEFTAEGIRQILSISFPKKELVLRRIARMLQVDDQILEYAKFIKRINDNAITDENLTLNATLLARDLARTILHRVNITNRAYAVFVVAEGIANRLPTKIVEKNKDGRPIRFDVLGLGETKTIGVDAHFNPRLSDIKIEGPLLNLVKKETNELGLKVKFEPRSIGYEVRAGVPCQADVNLALSLGHEAVNLLAAGESGRMVVVKGIDTIRSVSYDDLPKDETGHLLPRRVDLTRKSFEQAVAGQFYKGEEEIGSNEG